MKGGIAAARRFFALSCAIAGFSPAMTHAGAIAAGEICPRPAAGGSVVEPEDLRSRDGVLQLDMTLRNVREKDGTSRYCYLLSDGAESPNLRLKPGDELILTLKNRLTEISDLAAAGTAPAAAATAKAKHVHVHPTSTDPADPCTRGAMTSTSTNLHFHGLSVPPVCHQDEVFKTSIQPDDAPFEYRFRIPADEPPGLYWYHPHIHGFSAKQVLGGASGALIVEGLERANPAVAGLPERVLVIRDQDIINPTAPPSPSEPAISALLDRDGDSGNNGTGYGKPAKDLSVNFVPVPYPDYPMSFIKIRPNEKQLWRVLNASSVTYLNLALLLKHGHKFRAQWIGVVAIDGVPINVSGSAGHDVEWRDSVVVPPGARVEFIMTGPPLGVDAELVTRLVDTGQGGENDPNRALVSLVAEEGAPEPQSTLPATSAPLPAPARPWLGGVTPTRTRKLYFSEELVNPQDPNGDTRFYLTVDGQKPTQFDPTSTEPNIVVHQGDVEDWIIENRSTELHAFHIHQVHFQIVEWLGIAVNEQYLRDTINVPYFNGRSPTYPTVRLRMDFRDPDAVGTFFYHCHLLDHEDAGMMGLIRVEAAPATTSAHD